MDLGDTATNALIILAIIFMVAINLFLRRQPKEKTQLEVVLSLLSEINRNQKLIEDFQFHLQVKRFKTESWQRNKTKVDFLDRSLLTTLDTAFSMAESFNRDIDAARKHKSTSYLATISVDKLKEPLAKSQQGLEEWLQANKGKPRLPIRRGLFG